MNSTIRIKLSIMMFLEFFIWGAWFVTLGTFLGNNLKASGSETAAIFSTQSWGAIIAPFIIGLIADRYFNAEKILGILHLIGAFLMYQMYQSEEVGMFYTYVLSYMILYMPTLALVNSVSFNQMKDPEKEFANIRVWGTIGWILAGLSISFVFHWDAAEAISEGMLKNTFLLAGIAALVLGIFSFSLPKTPPKVSDEKIKIGDIIGLDALKLLKDKNFAIFFISSILICIPLAFYYQNAHPFLTEAGVENPTGKMAIGQISEALFLLLIPVFFTRFGFKKTILVGMLAWAIRYVLFAYGNGDDLSFMLIIGIALHGICYDFFFVSGQIYTNSKAGEKYKSAAQGLITLATYGVGMLIGFAVAGWITDNYKMLDGAINWEMVWIIPAGIALAVFLLFALLFNEKNKVEETSSAV
ncbi:MULTISPECIES: nucleoside permease [Flavobacterium]|uniref:Nucleoside permease n=1 Tax=Flavobacterium yafengii TaxID=3041253 RepID=A0AAW6TT52_9FLAO|nr:MULTISPECIES: nucleoside permease [Flavobacterium]MDI5888705.1 nucleoside permease [Flavobacterium yafengii]MDI5951000.1 nucleoside permease [Flavobacterium yafengii]PIF62981.1 nucleoside transporter [Flavobacterium sp. 11]RKS14131.1 nucleoside transporter [Flavobacterium sp. 120]WKL44038.1 nucleoside permease [Flavobacterium sp. ZE23DGlu08]